MTNKKLKLKIYNYLSGKKEYIKPLKGNIIRMYTCGPTVYNFVHIGNLRTFVFEDVLRRTLEYAGYTVKQVMNITDVDDKIIRGSKSTGKNIKEFVLPYEQAFFKDIKKLNIKRAWRYPRATRHIRQMRELIEKLLKKKYAYIMDGSVYFDISRFKNYGRLSGIHKAELKAGARVDTDEYSKDSAQDFVLWKAKKQDEPYWKTPFGEGRPGWHIECSAMSMCYLGESFDLHAGGIDLLFPHHENEIAQSEAATGKRFAKYFVEGEHLLVEGQKMSKSLGNVYTLRDIENKGFNPLAFRYLILTSHYRSKLNFTWKSLTSAKEALNNLYTLVRKLKSDPKKIADKKESKSASLVEYEHKFNQAISDDLNTPKALAVMWDMLNEVVKNPERFNQQAVVTLLYRFDSIFGLGLKDVKSYRIPLKIRSLIKKREALRDKRQWQAADRIREKLLAMGWVVQDTPSGPELSKVEN